jgi:CPA1 family monovalent cation:H+ antiporter
MVTAASGTGRGGQAQGRAIPPSVVAVVVGLAVAAVGPALAPTISPGVILAIVLPGLVFEAAFRTELSILRPAAAGVLLLAIPGVVVVAVVVAVLLALTTSLSTAEGFVVGAMVAATDPAAVLSTFRRVRVPERLATTVEMESLVNDGTGIVLFGLALAWLAGGGGSLGGSIAAFVLIGSTTIGLVAGWIAVLAARRIDSPVLEVALTGLLAYGTYLAATAVGQSGVIATLVAASVFGAGARRSLTARTTDAIDVIWEVVAFGLTIGVFVLVGLSIALPSLVHAAGPIASGVVAILVARALVVYGVLGGASQLARRPIPSSWLHVLFWAGLRGAVSVALALSLPADLPNRDLLQAITFGVVLFTLLVQGTTATWLVRRVGASTAAG